MQAILAQAPPGQRCVWGTVGLLTLKASIRAAISASVSEGCLDGTTATG